MKKEANISSPLTYSQLTASAQVLAPNLRKKKRKTHYTPRKIRQNLSAESHGTIHHHYAKTRRNSIKKNFPPTPPSSGGGRNFNITPTMPRGGHHPTSYPFFLPSTPLSIPELSLSVDRTFYFVPSPSYLQRTPSKCDRRLSVSFCCKEKNLFIKMRAQMCLGHGSIGRRGNVSYTEGCFLYAFVLKKKCTPTEAELLLGTVPTDIRFVSNFDNKAYIFFFIRFFAFLLYVSSK